MTQEEKQLLLVDLCSRLPYGVIKSGKLIASLSNCICYTFSAVVIKFISEVNLWVAISVQASTNFLGCYLAMLFCEHVLKRD